MRNVHVTYTQDYQLDREMPASPDAEKAILGAIFLDNEAFAQTETISAEDFSLDAHRRIFRVMAGLWEEKNPIDFVTATNELVNRKELESVGGVAYVTSLTDGLPRVKNIEQYVNIVLKCSQRRKFILILGEAISKAYEPGDENEELIANTDRKLCDIQNRSNSGPKHASEVVMEIREEFERVRSIDKSKAAIGFSTGVPALDKEILGYHKGEMVLIAGETSSGKSTLMRQGIHANLASRIPTLVFTYEVYGRSFVTNMLSPVSMIPGNKLRDFRELSDQAEFLGKKSEVEMFNSYLDGIKDWKLWIEDDSRNNHIDQVCSTARAMIRRYGIESIFLDQVSLVKGTGSNETERMEYISKCLVSLAHSENVPVIALSQFNRDKERQAGKRPPRKGDVKQAARLEEDAATEIFVWQEEINKHWLIVAKQRNGPLANVAVTLDRAILWFEDGHRS